MATRQPTIHAASKVGRELLEELPTWTMAVDPGESCGLAIIGSKVPFKAHTAMQDYIFTLTAEPEGAGTGSPSSASGPATPGLGRRC